MEGDEFFSYNSPGARPKVPCYRVGQTKLKSQLKAKYPFLSDDQINRRAKQEWNKTTGNTPGKRQTQKPPRETCYNSNKRETCYNNDNKKETCYNNENKKETCYNDNKKETCYNNHNKKETCYNNDNKKETCYNNDNKKETCYNNNKKKETCYNKGASSRTLDRNKGRHNTKKDSQRYQFDFFQQEPELSPSSHNKGSECMTQDAIFAGYCSSAAINKTEDTYATRGNFESSNTSDDDSDDNILIRREDEEFTTYPSVDSQKDQVETTHAEELVKNKIQKSKKRTKSEVTDSKEIPKSTKKARLYEYEENNSNEQICSEKSPFSTVDSRQMKSKRKNNTNNTSDDDSDDNVLIRREDEEFNTYPSVDSQKDHVETTHAEELVKNKVQKSKKRTKSEVTDSKEIPKATKKARLYEYEENNSNEQICSDKSPFSPVDSKSSQSSSEKKGKGKNRLKLERKPAPTPEIHTQDSKLVSMKTPALPSKDVIDENTPQLDGALLTTLQCKINEAPKKKTKKQSDIPKSNSKRHEGKGASKRVTKSLMPKTLNRNNGDKSNVDIPVEINNTMSDSSTVALNVERARSLDKTLLCMNPSGDAIGIGMKDSENINIAEHIESCNVDDDMCVEEGIQPSQPSQHGIGDIGKFRKSKLFLPDAGIVSSSQSSFSSAYSMNEAYKHQENPALLKSLNNLKMCVAAADLESDITTSEHSGLLSPRLLSPALSGISEAGTCYSQITSTSGSSQTDITDSIVPDIQMNQFKAVHTPTDSGLCQLFRDVTPPERKTSGEFKTKRILASERGDRNDNFKQLFDPDEDVLFP